MKKVIIIIAIVLALIIASMAAIFGIVFKYVNKELPSISAEEFRTSMSNKNFAVVSANSQFPGYDYIKQVYIALDPNNNYQIEFYEFNDNSYSTQFFNNNVSNFEASKGNSSSQSKVNLKNSSKYTLTSNGNYMVVSVINNTGIYAKVNEKYKNEVNSVLKDLGY